MHYYDDPDAMTAFEAEYDAAFDDYDADETPDADDSPDDRYDERDYPRD
jgi:hypothetical protein